MGENLFLVLRDKNQNPTFRNEWIDDNRPKWISTTPEIAELCKKSKLNNERVFIHRTGDVRRICCSLEIESVEEINRNTMRVNFNGHKVLNSQPTKKLEKGESFYWGTISN